MLIIFDCDGVLVDSEWLGAQVFSDVLSEFDIPMSVDECFDRFHGKTLSECFDYLEEKFNIVRSKKLLNRVNESTKSRFSAELKPVKKIDRVLSVLKKHSIPMCVASNGGIEKVNNSLQTARLDSYFSAHHRFSAEFVRVGKPAPDVFLLAADCMGVLARFAWVIEDSLPGCVSPQKKQGMKLIYFCSHQREDPKCAET